MIEETHGAEGTIPRTYLQETEIPHSKVVDPPEILDLPSRRIGTLGYLFIFIWSLCMVLFVPPEYSLISGGLCLLVSGLLYRHAFRRILHWRWLLFLLLLTLPTALWIFDGEQTSRGASFEIARLFPAFVMFVRGLVVLVSVEGFASRVDISEVAGLLERTGLRGLGFAMGVAINLLPSLRQSTANAWHSLWMRGGLRSHRIRSLQYLLMTVVINTLRRAEDVALAAESRAFTPERSQPLPLKKGRFDGLILAAVLVSVLIIAFGLVF